MINPNTTIDYVQCIMKHYGYFYASGLVSMLLAFIGGLIGSKFLFCISPIPVTVYGIRFFISSWRNAIC